MVEGKKLNYHFPNSKMMVIVIKNGSCVQLLAMTMQGKTGSLCFFPTNNSESLNTSGGNQPLMRSLLMLVGDVKAFLQPHVHPDGENRDLTQV
jgi:hypothetical protein